jgi:outer membrane usher protein
MTVCGKSVSTFPLLKLRSVFLLVSFFAFLGGATPSFAQQHRTINPYGTDVEFTVGLREQQAQLGEITLHIRKDGTLSLSPDALVAALGAKIIDAFRQDLLRLPTQDGRADFDAIGKLGFDLTFNEEDLDLMVTIPVQARPSRDYRILAVENGEIGAFDPPASFSLAANLSLSGDYSHSDFGSQFKSAATLGVQGRAAGIAYQSRFRLSGTTGQFARESSRIIFDDVTHALRWQFGDVQPFTTSTVGGDDLLGFGVNRETQALQPERFARMRATQTFTILEPSEVIVSVNGRVVTRRSFSPGNYNIADFPFVQGRNLVELDIINQAGERERLSFNQFLDSRLLEAGHNDFGFAVGITSTPNYLGSRTYDRSNLALNAHYIRGVSEQLTLGLSTTINTKRSIVLATGVHAGKLGATSGRLGLTTDDIGARIAVAGLGLVRAIGTQGTATNSSTLRFGIDGRFDLNGESNETINASIGYSWPLTKTTYANVDMRFSERTGTASFQTSMGLSNDLRLDVALDWRFSSDPSQRGAGISIGLSRRFGAIGQGRARYDSRLGEGRVTFNTNARDGLGQWLSSWEASSNEQGGSLSAAGSAFYNRFDISTQASDAWQSSRHVHRLVRTGSAIAFANGKFALGRPVSDSFAIISGHKSLSDYPISFSSQAGGATPIAKTGLLGPALITGLGSYAPRVITVDVQDPPEGYDIGSGTFRVAPPLFGGYHFIVGSDNPNSIVGILTLANGQPAGLIAGTATSPDWPEREQIVVFTNALGHFSLSGLGQGRWLLKMRGLDAPFEFSIGQNAPSFIELGTLRAKLNP